MAGKGQRTKRTTKKAVPTQNGRSDAWTSRFLATLAKVGVVSYACKAAKVGRTAVYARRKNDLEFAEAWAVAEESGTDELEKVARDRAKKGSDTLLIFLLKAARPDKYRENLKVTHAGTIHHEIDDLTEAELDDRLTSVEARIAEAEAGQARPPLPS